MCALVSSSGERFCCNTSVPTSQVAPWVHSTPSQNRKWEWRACLGGAWGTGRHMAAAASRSGVDHSGPSLYLLAPGLHPMETRRHITSVLDSLSVCFW